MFYAALLLDMRAAKEIRLFGLAGFLRRRMLGEMRSGQDEERRQDRLALSVDSLLSLATGLVAAAALGGLRRTAVSERPGHGGRHGHPHLGAGRDAGDP